MLPDPTAHGTGDAAERRAVLAARLRAAGAGRHAASIPRRPRGDLVPMSFAQERLWFLWRYEPEATEYNSPLRVNLHGPLDVEALRRAFELIVARHEILRTTLVVADGMPMQRIGPPAELELPVHDLTDLDREEAEATAAALLSALTREPFDLERGPILRLRLVRLAPEDHSLFVVIHHAFWDGWSRGVLLHELGTAYEALAADRAPELPELPVQYADYALWQRERFQGERLERLLGWWREFLAGAPPTSTMPTDHPRPAHPTHRSDCARVHLPPHLAEAVRLCGRAENCTPFMTLFAAWAALQQRYSGQDDLVIGIPTAGRPQVELEGLIGCFINMIPVRVDLSGDPDFPALLRRVRDAAVGAYDHQDLPFERLVEELGLDRDPSLTPVFQVAMQVRNFARTEPRFADLRVEVPEFTLSGAKFDLDVELTDGPEGVLGMIEYAVDLYEATTAQRMVDHFANLLAGIAEHPDRRLSQLPVLSAAERDRAVVEWNRTTTAYPRVATIHDLFDARAAAHPEAVAVRGDDATATYGELAERADRLAAYLAEAGVALGDTVAICLEWSPDLLTAVLATLKAGAAYLPLDPEHPAARLEFMLRDGGARVLLTHETMLPRLPEYAGPIVCLDRDAAAIAARPAMAPPTQVAPEDLAYITYTSGSTGEPKGVAVTHRGVVRLVVDTDYVHLGPDDVIAQLSSFAFDASTFEIFGTLLTGARLALIPRAVVLDPVALCARLRSEGVTTMFITTALFNRIAADVPDGLAGIGTVIFGGEACDPDSVRRVLETGPPQRLLHAYGPTENTTFSTTHEVTAVAPGARTVPIGRPIANSTAYVLDAHGEPVPPGAVGEIYVGGDGLAQGYWRRPELTAERFVPHPFSGRPGERLYRTGDLARQLPDGVIEWVGRVDDQVKIRGHRVEPAEIEAALSRHPGVREAVVLARAGDDGQRRLVAWVATHDPETPTALDLREWLAELLPRALVPAQFVLMAALPLGPTGKVDRGALPEPDASALTVTRVHLPPRDDLERALVATWERVLERSDIGVRDSFFDLGGHSLLAARLMAEIEATLGVSPPLAALFAEPTIESLARELRAAGAAADPGVVLPLVAGRPGPTLIVPYVLAAPPTGYRRVAEALDPDINLTVTYDLPREDDARAGGLEGYAARLVRHVLAAQPEGPYYLVGHCAAGPVAWEMAQQMSAAGREVALLVLIEARAPGLTPRVAALRERIRRNLRRARRPDGGGWLGHLRERAGNRWAMLVGPALQRMGFRLPPEMQAPVTQAAARRMRDSYHFRPWNGRVAVIRSTGTYTTWDEPADLGWSRFVEGGELDLHEIDTTHEILVEAEAEKLAAALSTCVRRTLAARDPADA